MRARLVVLVAAMFVLAALAARSPVAIAQAGSAVCPRNTSLTDGCAYAQSSGSFLRANFFTSYTGVNYGAKRPPWNVAGVDYPVGHAGSLHDPVRDAGLLPACAKYSLGRLNVNVQGQDCLVEGFDFTQHGGTYVEVTGATNNTFTLRNSKYAPNTAIQPYYGIVVNADNSANIHFIYDTVPENFAIGLTGNSGGIFCMCGGTGTLSIEYTYLSQISCRVDNAGASTSLVFRYNYLESIGYTPSGCHAEIEEWITNNTVGLDEQRYNLVYQPSRSTAGGTSLVYATAGYGPNSNSTIDNVVISNNVYITRPTGSPPAVTIAGEVWLQADANNKILNTTVTNNYFDPAGSYFAILVYNTGSGSLGNVSCSGNMRIDTGLPLVGTLEQFQTPSGTVTSTPNMVCN
jgi:hypothetical protein